MEHAWIATKDDEVEQILASIDFLVRPPDESVPSAMLGTDLGAVFSRLVRMNEGERHTTLRRNVEEQLARFDTEALAALAQRAAQSMPLRDVAAYVVAATIGLDSPEDCAPLIRDFAGAIAAGASDDAVARGVAATPKLLERMPRSDDPDTTANALGFLFQTYAATATLIENRLQGRDTAPAVVTRRWAARDVTICGMSVKRGDAVVVLLTSPTFYFGAGRHQCPGRSIAEAIAHAVVRAQTAR